MSLERLKLETSSSNFVCVVDHSKFQPTDEKPSPKGAWLGYVDHLNFGGHQLLIVSGTVNLVRQWVPYFSTVVDNCWWHLPSRSVIANCIAATGRLEGLFDYHVMRHRIFSMRWATSSRGSLDDSWASYIPKRPKCKPLHTVYLSRFSVFFWCKLWIN